MVTVSDASSCVSERVDLPSVVAKRLEVFGSLVLAGAMNRPVQRRNGGVYLRGLIEQGPRKSLEPMVERLGGDADYQSLQQFLADSPWDPAVVVRAVAERVVPAIGVQAWVLDDTGFPKDGKRLAGGEASVLGDVGEDRELPDRRVGPRRWEQGDGAVGVGAVPAPRTGVMTPSADAKRRSLTRSSSRPSRSSGLS